MKKSIVFLAGVLLLLGFVQAQDDEGSPIAAYTLTKTDGTYRNLTEGATTLKTLPATLNQKFVLSFEKDTVVPVPTYNIKNYPYAWSETPKRRVADIALPQKMMFGRTQVEKVGMTTDGSLFFGDTVIPSFINGDNNITYYMATNAKSGSFLYFSLVDLSGGKYTGPTPMYSGKDTRIGYETVGDTLFIAYENVIIKESATDSQIVSWNYRINTANGDIVLQTKGFYSGDGTYAARNFAYGLVGTKNSDAIWLNFAKPQDVATADALVFNPIQKNSFTEGSLLTFKAPEPCERVLSPVVDWRYSTTDNSISLNGTTWEATNRAIFLLSTTESVSADDSPEDKTEYRVNAGSVTIGSNKGLLAEMRADGSTRGLTTAFEKLEAETDYWINAYVYNSACKGGPLYSQPVVQKITTSMLAPAQDKVVLGDFTTESMKLTLGEPAPGRSYVVALSQVSLNDRYRRISYNLLQNGKTYEVGDEVGKAVVKYSKVSAGTYTIDNLKEGTVYRVYVWLCEGEGDAIQYSSAYCEEYGRTTFVAPATIDFNDYVAGDSAKGWITSGFGRYTGDAYTVSEYSNEGPRSARTPAEGDKVLFATMTYAGEETLPYLVHTTAVSPVVLKGESTNIAATFSFGFYTTGNGMTVCKLKAEDSVVVSWAESQDAENWHRLGAITSATQLDAAGFVSLSLPAFIPQTEGFCFKVDAYLLVKSGSDALGIAIENIVLEEDRPCKYPVNITVPKESVRVGSAVVSWEDANIDPARIFAVRYRAEGQGEWLYDSVNDESITLKNLSPSTLYTVGIQALCKAEAGVSMERTVTFKTGLAFPYSYVPNETGALPEGCAQYRGKPGQTLTAIDMQDREEPQWSIGNDALEDEVVLVNRLQQNINAWLMFPAVNTDLAGTVRIKLNLSAWGFDMIEGHEPKEAVKTHDSLFVFISETGDFKADRRLVGCVNIDSLHYRTVKENGEEKVVYDSVAFDFAVEREKPYTLALYVPAKTGDLGSFEVKTILAVSSVEMYYTEVIYPAVTDLHTEALTKESVTIAWNGQADEYRLLWKERAADGDYTVVETEELSHSLTGLKPKTQYAYYVYGIYGGKKGEESEVQYFRTLTDVLDTVKTPAFSVIPGEVAKGTEVEISCATTNATIYYTTDGTTPTTASTEYKEAIVIDEDMTIKAFAVKSDMIDSKVAEAAYTVKIVAIESDLLSEVKVYPNPTDGLFNVAVPEDATVEVVAANGTLVNRLGVPAGTTALRLNQAGMYFVKVSVNGQSVVRKIVVR